MADYIQFISPDGNAILVEVTEDETQPEQGVQKAGLIKDKVGKQIAIARTSFEEAIQHTIQYNANAFIQSIRTLPILFRFRLRSSGQQVIII